MSQILWCFYRLWGADISVLSQVVILSVYEKKNGTDEIWCSCSPGIPLGFWAKILWSRGFTKILESQLHGSQRKSYLSAPFFFYLRFEWLVRGRLYMPNLCCEPHHRICQFTLWDECLYWVLPLVFWIDNNQSLNSKRYAFLAHLCYMQLSRKK